MGKGKHDDRDVLFDANDTFDDYERNISVILFS